MTASLQNNTQVAGAVVDAAAAALAAFGEAQEDGEAVGMGESAEEGGEFTRLHISIVIEI